MKFRYNAFFRILTLINGLLFVGIFIPKYLEENYLEGTLELVIGLFWLISYFLYRRPYVEISNSNLIIRRGLLKPVEYSVYSLEILKHTDHMVVFSDISSNKVMKIKIYYGYLSFADNQKLREE